MATYVFGRTPEDTAPYIMGRVHDGNDNLITQSAMSSITYTVTDVDEEVTQAETSLTIASVVFDSLQTDSRWTLDSTGYNFAFTLPVTAIPEGGRTYIVHVVFTPVTGPIWVRDYQITTPKTSYGSGRIAEMSDVLLDLGLSTQSTAEELAIVEAVLKRAEGAIRRYLHYDPVQAERTEYYPQHDAHFSALRGNWDINSSGTTAFFSRDGVGATENLLLRHLPIRDSTNARVWIDLDGRGGAKSGAFSSDTEKTFGDDFWPNFDMIDTAGAGVCHDGILKSIGLWPVSPASVKVTYTAGYSRDELRGDDALIDASPIWETCVRLAVTRAQRILAMKKSSRIGFVAGAIGSEKLGDYSYKLDTGTTASMFSGAWDLLPDDQERLTEFVNYAWSIAG